MHGLWHVFDYTEEQNGKTEKVKALGLEQIQAQVPETASPVAASLSIPGVFLSSRVYHKA